MRIDFHSHGKLSKKTEFSLEFFLQSVREARASGLDAIAMTEHFNTIRFYDIFETLDKHFLYTGDYYAVEGVRVFTGMEVDVASGGHILAIGPKQAILSLRRMLEGCTEKGAFVAFEQWLDWSEHLPLLRIGAHPHRESNPLTHHPTSLLRRLDAFDLNAKDLKKHGSEMEAKVRAFAKEIGIPVVAGSDAHYALQFVSVCNKFERECATASELKEQLLESRYAVELSPCLDVRVRGAAEIKRLLKRQMEISHGVDAFGLE